MSKAANPSDPILIGPDRSKSRRSVQSGDARRSNSSAADLSDVNQSPQLNVTTTTTASSLQVQTNQQQQIGGESDGSSDWGNNSSNSSNMQTTHRHWQQPEYITRQVIGEGSFGIAWLCTHSASGTDVIVKCLAPTTTMTEKDWTSAKAEILCLSLASSSCNDVAPVNTLTHGESSRSKDQQHQRHYHPNVIQFHEAVIDEDNDALLIVMEFADAGDLRRILKERAALAVSAASSSSKLSGKVSIDESSSHRAAISAASCTQTSSRHATASGVPSPLRQLHSFLFRENEALFIFLQIAMAVFHLHSKNILHRDLKPANVFMVSNGLVKIGDFGFSQYSGERHDSTLLHANHDSSEPVGLNFCGTPYYVAPEVWTSKRYSPKSEVWSLGVILYELVTLERPFYRETVADLCETIKKGTYFREHPALLRCSQKMRQLVECLLVVSVDSRPDSTQLFQIPFVRQQLAALRKIVMKNEAIPLHVRVAWDAEASRILLKVSQLPDFFPSPVPSLFEQGEGGALPAACRRQEVGVFDPTAQESSRTVTASSTPLQYSVPITPGLSPKRTIASGLAPEMPLFATPQDDEVQQRGEGESLSVSTWCGAHYSGEFSREHHKEPASTFDALVSIDAADSNIEGGSSNCGNEQQQTQQLQSPDYCEIQQRTDRHGVSAVHLQRPIVAARGGDSITRQ